ncbi:uncharacterized protein LOC141909039 [Tubulanus polymorphus]|uniref:uncharacterized protein LOC141909039 n=1 Tax=Tubulanus polymorphus TaxID=672921 RepID=UPI003DA458C1
MNRPCAILTMLVIAVLIRAENTFAKSLDRRADDVLSEDVKAVAKRSAYFGNWPFGSHELQRRAENGDHKALDMGHRSDNILWATLGYLNGPTYTVTTIFDAFTNKQAKYACYDLNGQLINLHENHDKKELFTTVLGRGPALWVGGMSDSDSCYALYMGVVGTYDCNSRLQFVCEHMTSSELIQRGWHPRRKGHNGHAGQTFG